MITTLSWLKNHLTTKANLNQVVERLTEIGLEVENIKSSNYNLDSFIISKIIKSQKHPNADKLKLFEVEKVRIRFRPSHFPFTEPSAEVDVGYKIQDGKIKIGEGNKWLEILGCGMVHPNVLKNAKVNPKQYQGYAFGVGIDRLAMLKYGISDLRAFFESDIRWLEFYGFDPLDVPTNYRGLSR